MFHLVLDRWRYLIHQLHHVRTQLARRWIDDLEFFLDTDGEAVSHGWPSRSRGLTVRPFLRAPKKGASPVSYRNLRDCRAGDLATTRSPPSSVVSRLGSTEVP